METLIGIGVLLAGAGIGWLCFGLGVYFLTGPVDRGFGSLAWGRRWSSSAWRRSGANVRPLRNKRRPSARVPATVGVVSRLSSSVPARHLSPGRDRRRTGR
jgi:hypothetical protein